MKLSKILSTTWADAEISPSDPYLKVSLEDIANNSESRNFLYEANLNKLRETLLKDDSNESKDDEIQEIINSNHEETVGYHKQILDELQSSRTEHRKLQTTIEDLSSKLAEKEDIILSNVEIIKKIETESENIRINTTEKINELQINLSRFLPYKRSLTISLYFFSLFSIALLSNLFLGVKIIHPFWNLVGLTISSGFIMLSYALFIDWRNRNK